MFLPVAGRHYVFWVAPQYLKYSWKDTAGHNISGSRGTNTMKM
jgi:hypothetical protein